MRSLLFATLLLSSISSMAAEGGSEFFWQAESGKSYLSPQLGFASGEVETKAGPTGDISLFGIGLEYENGLSEQFSAGVSLSYSSGETEVQGTSRDQEGLGDIDFFIKGSSPLTSGNLKYGAELSLSPGNSETDSNGDSNAYSGRHTLTPYIGYETSADGLKFGGKIAYQLHLTDQKDEDASGNETKTSGGADLDLMVFIETATSTGTFGGKIGHSISSDVKDEETGEKSDVSPLTMLGVYGTSEIKEGLTFFGELNYGILGESDTIDNGNMFALLGGLRIAL